MMGATHLAAGVIITGALSPSPIAIVVGGIAALLPDIDEPKSMIGKVIPIIPRIVSLLGHRTITHSVLGMCLFSIPVAMYTIELLPYFFIGYSSHLALDSLTYEGVPLLYPLSAKSFGIRIGKTAGLLEAIVIVLLALVLSLKM